MKKILMIAALLTLVFVGCGKEEETTSSAHEDYKVISLAPSVTENIIGMGMEDNLIAVDTYSTFDETADLVMLDAMAINAEEVLLLEPTHIFVPDYNYSGDKQSDYEVFVEADIKVIPVTGASSIEGIYEGIIEIGDAIDNSEAAEKLVSDTKEKVEEIVAMYAEHEVKTVYMEIAPAPDIYAAAANSFTNEMITLVAGENIFNDIDDDYFIPSVENIIQENPEVIITSVSYTDDPIGDILSRDGFSVITAVENGDVYLVDANATSRPSHNFVAGLEEIAKAIHNEN